MVTTGHSRRQLARALAAGLVDLPSHIELAPHARVLPGTWATLPAQRRGELVDRAEDLIAEDDYSVDLDDDPDVATAGHLYAA